MSTVFVSTAIFHFSGTERVISYLQHCNLYTSKYVFKGIQAMYSYLQTWHNAKAAELRYIFRYDMPQIMFIVYLRYYIYKKCN